MVAFTGHRPDKLGGYEDSKNLKSKIISSIDEKVRNFIVDGKINFISGMALGVDQWAAEYGIKANIPVHAYVPFPGQDSAWPDHAKSIYNVLLNKCKSVKLCSEAPYAAWKMQRRNEMMVDDCDLLIAVWDESPGGTANCVKYAQKKRKPIIFINPKDLK
jgi:uncharacterized phage-like protein YoqJ